MGPSAMASAFLLLRAVAVGLALAMNPAVATARFKRSVPGGHQGSTIECHNRQFKTKDHLSTETYFPMGSGHFGPSSAGLMCAAKAVETWDSDPGTPAANAFRVDSTGECEYGRLIKAGEFAEEAGGDQDGLYVVEECVESDLKYRDAYVIFPLIEGRVENMTDATAAAQWVCGTFDPDARSQGRRIHSLLCSRTNRTRELCILIHVC